MNENTTFRLVTTICFLLCVLLGVGVGYVLWGRALDVAEDRLDTLRDVARELDAERAESARIVEELASRNEELATRGRLMEEALERERARNRELTEARERAERRVTAAVSESDELTGILEEVLRAMDELFSGGRVDDRGTGGDNQPP